MADVSRHTPRVIRFGVFELDLHAGELRKAGVRLRLPAQSIEVLTLLLDRSGDLVTREELHQRLWPTGTFVDFEHGLNAAVNRLREALGDAADRPRFIETVPRRGYRFVAPVDRPQQTVPLDAAPTAEAGRVIVDPGTHTQASGDPPAEPSSAAAPSVSAIADQGGRRFLPAPRAAALAVAAVALGFLTASHIAPRPPAARTSYAFDVMLDGLDVVAAGPALSPDGRSLVYSAEGRLWRRALSEFTSKPLPDTGGAEYVFWAPDSRQIAFVRNRRLWRLPVDAANATPVGDAPAGLSGAGAGVWTVTGDLVVGGSDTVGLWSAPLHGGKARDILPIDKNREIDFHHVAALPAGRGFLLTIHRLKGLDTIAALVSGKRTTVLQLPGEAVHSAVYSPDGYLLFERETTIPGIWAVRFAIDRLATDGAPFLVVPGGSSPTLASDGTLAFVRRWPQRSELVWVDRNGSIEPIGDLHGQLGLGSGPVIALSPDARTLALSIESPVGAELWSYDLSRRTTTRLTTGATRVTSPTWTPDGKRILFGAFGRGRLWNVYSIPATETREPVRVLPQSAVYRWPCTISPDGRWLIYAAEGTERVTDLWIAPLTNPGTAQPLLKTPFRDAYARFSPDGRMIVYVSDESGSDEVYVRAFPINPERLQVSTTGGSMPVWAPDGRAICYRTHTAMMEVAVTQTAAGLVASPPQQLFRIDPDWNLLDPFVLASDGRFLFARAKGRAHVGVLLNWSASATQLESALAR
jgi:DNA-binding winged helix-turn-helix (wHTH) protein/WD40 repeat protein